MEYGTRAQIPWRKAPDPSGIGRTEGVKGGRRLHVRHGCRTAECSDRCDQALINAAIEALAKAFSERGLKDGVQVNSVSPGPVMTSRRQGLIEKAAAANGISVDTAKAKFLEQAGIARFGEAEEVAELMAFVVSPKARWLTGTVLRMDGGEIKTV